MQTRKLRQGQIAGIVWLVGLAPVYAGTADVVSAEAQHEGEGAYSFSVTVRHRDVDWGHYADRWEVVTPDGEILAVRVLAASTCD